MAQSLEHRTLDDARVHDRMYPELWQLRLALGWATLLAALVGLFAVSWDIQWHIAVGRDRTLTAPHLFILGSITALGLAAVAAVLIETWWARRRPSLASQGTTFAGFFTSSLGAYLVGYGALDSAIAFPLDQYWHTLYGIDVSIWAPFHVMALVGLCLSCLGVAYMLAAGAHLAAQAGARRAAWVGYTGLAVAFATLLGVCSFFLLESLGSGFVPLGSLLFTVYPLMLGAFGTLVLVAARRALPGPGAATSVGVVYLLLGRITYLLVPPLMTALLQSEQQNVLPGAPTVSVVAMNWQYWLIIPAVLLDLVTWLARRQQWSWRKANSVTFVAAAIGISLAALCYSDFLTTAQAYANPQNAERVRVILHGALPAGGEPLIVGISLLLGVLGTFVGAWVGAGIGNALRRKDQ